MDASYLLQGCEKCPCTDKSRPYNVRTLVDLLKVHFQNFSHFGTPNKSQTRKINMSFCLTSGSDEGYDAAKQQGYFTINCRCTLPIVAQWIIGISPAK